MENIHVLFACGILISAMITAPLHYVVVYESIYLLIDFKRRLSCFSPWLHAITKGLYKFVSLLMHTLVRA